MSTFISGQELSRQFYQESVRPLLDATVPGRPHSAALLGRGSEVLGFDDEMSRDHDWGSRVLIFLNEEDHAQHAAVVEEAFRERLPARFRDQPTACGLFTLRGYFLEQLDFDLNNEITPRDWLTFAEQRLCMVTAGAVYHDEVGLQAARERFAYYPHDVWLYLLLAAWWRVHPEVNLVGRTGSVGDELGSAVIGAQLGHDLMQLCFLMERQYAPYSKWFGTAFTQLDCAADLSPALRNAVQAETWPTRETALMSAYEKIVAMHNALNITKPVSLEVHQMWNRPFKVVWGDFPGALRAKIQDPVVQGIDQLAPVGGIDQFREILWSPRHRQLLLRLFE